MPIAGRYLSILGAVLQVCLCILLFRRKMHQRLPFFSAYTIFSIVSETGSALLYKHYALYFKFYWINETFYVVLGFLAISEVFHWVFRNFYGIFWFRLIFPIVGILMLALAAVRSMLLPAPHLQKLMAAIVSLEIAVNFLEVGMLVLFFLLVSLFHMRWRQYAFGIVLGFGIIACSDLALYLLHSEFGTKFNFIAEITPSIAYIIAVVVWLAAFLPPQPDHPLKDWVPPLTPEEMVAELRQYTRAVKGVLKR